MTPHTPRPAPVEAEAGPASSGADIVQRLRDKNRGWHPDQIDAADAIEVLRAQVAALERDAARYRWLRDEAGALSTFSAVYWSTETAEALDAGIDSAMKA